MTESGPIPFLDLARHYRAVRPEIDAAITRVLERGFFILGPEGSSFETEFAATLGVLNAVGVANGTDAIELALRACGIGAGATVITSAHTAVPTLCAIVATGAKPLLVDIDSDTYNIDPEKLRETILEARTSSAPVRAIVPVHLYGHPADLDPILSLADEFELNVVEDVAQAQGALYQGRPVGQFGRASAFSFYPTKNLGAFGDGGLVATSDPVIAERLKMLRNYGEIAKYQNRIQGVNSRLDEIQAAILRTKLPHLPAWIDRRRAIADRYCEGLQGTGLVLPVERPGCRHSYHLYVVRLPDRLGSRDEFRRRLDQRGIGTSVHYPVPVHHQEAYRHLAPSADAFPVASQATREIVSLPLYPELLDSEVDRVCEAIRAVVRDL